MPPHALGVMRSASRASFEVMPRFSNLNRTILRSARKADSRTPHTSGTRKGIEQTECQ
ncbi:hypothetical protein ABIE67_006265 [Streptomyces sp. V4I8]